LQSTVPNQTSLDAGRNLGLIIVGQEEAQFRGQCGLTLSGFIHNYEFMSINMFFDKSICVFDAVTNRRAAVPPLPLGEKDIPGFLDHVSSGICSNFGIHGFGGLSKKARTDKS
jgi:hypothetical protein